MAVYQRRVLELALEKLLEEKSRMDAEVAEIRAQIQAENSPTKAGRPKKRKKAAKKKATRKKAAKKKVTRKKATKKKAAKKKATKKKAAKKKATKKKAGKKKATKKPASTKGKRNPKTSSAMAKLWKEAKAAGYSNLADYKASRKGE